MLQDAFLLLKLCFQAFITASKQFTYLHNSSNINFTALFSNYPYPTKSHQTHNLRKSCKSQCILAGISKSYHWQCQTSGSYSPTFQHGGLRSIWGYSVWDLWWTKWHWYRMFCKYLSFYSRYLSTNISCKLCHFMFCRPCISVYYL